MMTGNPALTDTTTPNVNDTGIHLPAPIGSRMKSEVDKQGPRRGSGIAGERKGEGESKMDIAIARQCCTACTRSTSPTRFPVDTRFQAKKRDQRDNYEMPNAPMRRFI